MIKCLQLFEDAQKLSAPVGIPNGRPWVGAETTTKTVRYEKTGVMGMEITTPEIGGEEEK